MLLAPYGAALIPLKLHVLTETEELLQLAHSLTQPLSRIFRLGMITTVSTSMI